MATASEACQTRRSRAMPPWAKGFASAAIFVSGYFGLQSLAAWHDTHAIFINASESLPNWALLVEAGRFPKRGDYIVFDPGRDPLVVKHFGAKPKPFAKIAYGVPGDVVSRSGERVLVNGHEVARLKALTRQGETLVPGPTGVVPNGCIFAASPHKDGFDSRYAAIGFVCGHHLIGVGEPIL